MVKHVPTYRLPPSLRRAIDAFMPVALDEGYNVDGGGGMCLFASAEFEKTCRDFRLDARIYEYDQVELERLWFVELPQPAAFHVVVRVAGYVIDWTATQFDQSLPCPLVWLESDWPPSRIEENDRKYHRDSRASLEIIDYGPPRLEDK